MAKISIDESLTGRELSKFLVANKKLFFAEKKATIKHSDPINLVKTVLVDKSGAVKTYVSSEGVLVKETSDTDSMITRSCVINTTNVMDSHDDVHIPGIWAKTLQENKSLYLLQEHSMTFKGIITDDISAMTKDLTWAELGFDFPGMTQALIFEANISKDRNEFMFNQYKQNYVKNHSVGMQYVNIELAINDPEEKDEYAVWLKYIGQVVNYQDAIDQGYFFPVTQAKVVEGSAVPVGSNRYTPTLPSKKNQSTKDTVQPQPLPSTEDEQPSESFDLDFAIRQMNFFKN